MKHKRVAQLLFIFFLFLRLLNAQTFQSVGTVGILAIITGIAIIAFLYLFSQIIRSNKLEFFAKEELKTVSGTAIVFSLILVFYGVLDYISSNFIPYVSYHSRYSSSYEGLLGRGREFTAFQITNLTIFEQAYRRKMNDVAVASSRSTYCQFLGVGFSLVVCSIYAFPLNQLSQGYLAIVTTAWIMNTLFEIFQVLYFHSMMLLMIGLILRVFSYTRGIGNALLALYIGFGVILPFSYLSYFSIYESVRSVIQNNNLNYLNKPLTFSTLSFECNPNDYNVNGHARNLRTMLDVSIIEPLLFELFFRYMLPSAFSIFFSLACIGYVGNFLGQSLDVFRLERLS